MAIIKSYFNKVKEMLAKGIKMHGGIITAAPVFTGKAARRGTCPKCGSKNGVVFKANNVPHTHYILACPKCKLLSHSIGNKEVVPEVQPDQPAEHPHGGHYCQGKTKKNLPCKNKALDNGYCGQHQDQVPQPEHAYEGQGMANKFLNHSNGV